MKNKKEFTINDLALMVAKGFKGVDEKFAKIDERFEKIDEKFAKIDERFEKIDEKFERIDKRFETMASKEDLKKMELDLKDHLDEKLGELKGDLVAIIRKEDKKIIFLADLLTEENIVNNKINKIFKMEPFPRTI